MSQVEIGEAAETLKALVERARAGEEVVLADQGHAVAKLVSLAAGRVLPPIRQDERVAEPDRSASGEPLPPRRLGLARGVWTIADDFDAPLHDELVDLFYDGPLFPDGSSPGSKGEP